MAQATQAPGPLLDTPVTSFETKVGHHPGLFVLFFAEMWERFSYYGMRALLILYMSKGFLHYADERAYAVYGAYTALVYMTPFIGGVIADRLLGQRAAVVLGGSLMGLGHLVMMFEDSFLFFVALALLIVGNGFFKPNIGTIVGQIYSPRRLTHKRDGAFTIFYMGVNLGAAMSPLLCGYIGERWGWHYGFGLATIGMIIGLAIFVAPTRVTQALIGAGALASAVTLVLFGIEQSKWLLMVNVFVAVAVIAAMLMALWALEHGAVPEAAGAAPSRPTYRRDMMLVLAGVVASVFAFAWLCDHSSIAGWLLIVVGSLALVYILVDAFRITKVERERLFVILVMCVFSMVFWAFFEQAGSSINNFTDRNVDRVGGGRVLSEADVGETREFVLSQAQLGYPHDGEIFTLRDLDAARQEAQEAGRVVRARWTIEPAHLGMTIEGEEVPTTVFQATNAIFIVIFGMVFTALWGFLDKRNMEPSTPVKFVLALTQLGLGFGVLWLGARFADARGMVPMVFLVLGYLLHTTGELCLSPVGLSMVSKLAPSRMVATMIGAWYLATAFSQYLAGLIAMLTGVSGEEGSEGAGHSIPPPIETLNVYADVFAKIAVASLLAGVVLLALSPFVKRWMHEEQSPSH